VDYLLEIAIRMVGKVLKEDLDVFIPPASRVKPQFTLASLDG